MPYLKGIIYILCVIFFGLKYITVISITTYKAIHDVLSLLSKQLEERISEPSFVNLINKDSVFFNFLQSFIKNLKNLLDNWPTLLSDNNLDYFRYLVSPVLDSLVNIISMIPMINIVSLFISLGFIIFIIKNVHYLFITPGKFLNSWGFNIVCESILLLSVFQWGFRVLKGADTSYKAFQGDNLLFFIYNFITFISYLINIACSSIYMQRRLADKTILYKFYLLSFAFFFVLSTGLAIWNWEGSMLNLNLPIYNTSSAQEFFLVTIGSKLGLFWAITYIHSMYLNIFTLNKIIDYLDSIFPNSALIYSIQKLMKYKSIRYILSIILYTLTLITFIHLIIIVSGQFISYYLINSIISSIILSLLFK